MRVTFAGGAGLREDPAPHRIWGRAMNVTDPSAPAARRGAAIARAPGWQAFRCSGADAVDLLGRLSTNDLAPLARGRAVTTIFLTPTGRIRHRVLLAPEDPGRPSSGLLALSEGAESFPAWIDAYTFAEDCRIEPLPLSIAFALGEGALGLAPAPLASAGEWAAHARSTWIRRDWAGLPVALVAAPDDAIADLEARALASSASVLDADGLLQRRVEHGEPAAGHELSEERFPLEAGLLDEISFTKGCYTGQEVVARQDTYGKVARRLVGLAFDVGLMAGEPGADACPQAGEELPDEGRGCAVTSVAPRPARTRDGRRARVALGFVSARHAVPGSEVATARGLRGIVSELPFLPD